ncbi:MAG: hypothetical protein ACT4PW_12065 [Acidimicrobiia bacterium]
MKTSVRWWAYGVIDRARPGSRRGRRADPPGASLEGVHPKLVERLLRAHARHPLRVNSGHRTSELQQQFFDCAQTRKQTGRCPPECRRSACNSANPPGGSNHEAQPFGPASALAVDCEPTDGDWDGFHAVAREEGLVFPIAGEPWHVEPTENPTPGRWSRFPDGW